MMVTATASALPQEAAAEWRFTEPLLESST